MTESAHPRALHLAAFDHRESFKRAVGEIAHDATGAERRVALKMLIWRGIETQVGVSGESGVLVDPDAGAVLDAAAASGATTAMALERSGQRWLTPDRPPTELRALLERHRPTYGKVLLRWHPGDPAERRAAQVSALGDLFELARSSGSHTMLELLVPAAAGDESLAAVEPETYRSEALPVRLADAIRQLAEAGIVPDLWKIDGVDRAGAARLIAHAVTETSGGQAGIVVLGAGKGLDDLTRWFRATAGVSGFCGFAIGRSIWWDPIRRHLLGELDESATRDAIGVAFSAVVDAYRAATGASA